MDDEEVKRIRGALTRVAFARLLGVTPLTVLRWELPRDNKEARRPRAKMIEALRKLAARGTGEVRADIDTQSDEPVLDGSSSSEPSADERLVAPLLDQLCTESWRTAEDTLTSLLSSGTLTSRVARTLATLGLVQVQVLAHMDLRGALAALVPILDEAARGELRNDVAARAHVMATFIFGAPDSRVHDLGRVNAHAARADPLLPADAIDLRIMCATSCIAAVRYLGPEVTLHVYKAHAECLERARSPLGRMLADALAGLVATARGDAVASAALGGRALDAAERMGHWGLVMGVLSDYAHRTLSGSQTPDVVLEIARHGRKRAADAALRPTEGFIRLLAAECEALCRLARFEDARVTAHEALGIARRAGLATYSLTATVTRLYAFMGDRAELHELAAHYEREASGPHRSAARVHESYVRGVACTLARELEAASEMFEIVCGAPDSVAGLEYILHAAHFESIVVKVQLGDVEGAASVLRRFDELLGRKASVWHGLMARRAEAMIMAQRGQMTEARLRIESTTSTFSLLGIAEGFLARIAPPLEEPSRADARAPSMAERLVMASERLGVQGLDADAFRRELAAVLRSLFPGYEPVVGGAELAAVGTTVEVPSHAGAPLRFGVRGTLDAEQRAFLQLLVGIAERRPEPVPSEPEVDLDGSLPEFVAVAPASRRLKSEVMQLSRSNAAILIRGESGSGKEVVARAIHDVSRRAGQPYVTFNCASVPRDLFEGQLFGHRKGSFTGATSDNPGVIRAADGGTLFLDEIGELPLEMQPKLLRFLENGEVMAIGEVKPRRVDVRIIAATHRDLDILVREGRFREDLFYRLNVVPIRVPPLRERKEDVTALARRFVARLCEPGATPPTLGRSAVHALQEHAWPGNVRELRNVVERAMAYSPVPSELQAEHLRLSRS